MIPFLPDADHTPLTRENDRDRYIAEQRVQDVSRGGTGGWTLSMTDDGAVSKRIKRVAGDTWDTHDKANTRQMLM